MRNLFQDIRYGLRALAKSPGFAAVAILTLALGIGANTAIFSVVQRVLLRPLPYPNPESLVQIFNTYYPAWPQAGLSPGDFQDWRRQARDVSEMSAYIDISQGFNLTGNGDPERVEAAYASAALFPMLETRASAGRTFLPDEDKPGSAPVVMLSHRFWESRFGADASIVGHAITLDQQHFTVIGILPVDFQLLRWPDIWMPVGQYPDDLTGHVHHPFSVVARLKPGIKISEAQAEFVSLNQQEGQAFPDTHKNWDVKVQPLEDASAAKLRSTLLVLLGAVGLVLLIACANIVNLLLARNAAREKEIALRTALGATQWRVIRQLLTESVLLSFVGGVLGLVVASVGIDILGALAPPDLSVVRETTLNGPVFGFAIAICLAAGIVCGLLPALRTLTQNLDGVLKQGTKGSSAFGSHRIHSALVVAEIALALIPLVGAGLLIRSFHRLLGVDPGFAADHILTMEVQQPQLSADDLNKMTNDQFTAFNKKQSVQFEEIAGQIQGLPGVKSVGGIQVLPLGSALRSASRFVIEGEPTPAAGARPVAEVRYISLGYFSAMAIPTLKGRAFAEADWNGSNVIINQAMARRFWPGSDPLGHRINLCSLYPTPCWSSIVGVVGNVHEYGLDATPTFDVYFTGGWTPFFVIRTASDPATLAAAATSIIHKEDAALPVTHVMVMDDLLSDSVSPRRFATLLIGVFAGLALLLAAVGIYGVMSYTVTQRTHEIGIRVALGAQSRDIWSLIVGRGAKLALAGIAIGFAGALALTRFLSSFLFEVRATDPVTFISVALLLALVALVACYIPARRAIKVDPLVALRYE